MTKLIEASRKARGHLFLAVVLLAGVSFADAARANEQIDFPPPGREYYAPYWGGYEGSGTGSSARVTVDPTGKSGYRTIKAALSAVRSGGTISIRPTSDAGTPYIYTENLIIKRPVTLQSALPGTKITVKSDGETACVKVDAKTSGLVTITDFTFLTPDSGYRRAPCVDVQGGVFSLMRSTVVATYHQPAISLAGGFSRIEENDITGGQVGVEIMYVPNGDVFLSANEIYENIDGVRIVGPTRPKILDNVIRNNIEHGLVITGGSGQLVGNLFFRNGGHGVYIQSTAPSDPLFFRANDIYENGENGIRLKPAAAGVIGSNRIYNNQGAGIRGYGSTADVTLDGYNDIYGNAYDRERYQKRGWRSWFGSKRDPDRNTNTDVRSLPSRVPVSGSAYDGYYVGEPSDPYTRRGGASAPSYGSSPGYGRVPTDPAFDELRYGR